MFLPVPVQSLNCVRLFVTPWITACQASLSITNSQSSLKLMSFESVMSSSHLILCHPLLLLPPIPPSIRVFSNESTLCMRWPKYWSFSFSINPSNEHPGMVSFRIDLLDFLAVQGTLRNLLQHHSSKASILWLSAFLLISSVQLLSHVQLFVTPWIAAHHASLSITNSRSLLKLMSIESVMPSSHPMLCHPLLLHPPTPVSLIFLKRSLVFPILLFSSISLHR